jgi:two-component system, NarL family, response regulator DevR
MSPSPREARVSSRMEPIKVLVVDDHEVTRVGLRTVLSREHSINVVGEAASVMDTIDEARRLQPNVVLMDVRLSDGSGVDACRAIRDSCPATRVLFLTSYQDDEAVLAAVIGGAAGYLLKHVDVQALLRAIHAVAQGQSILDPAITQPLLTRMRLQKEEAPESQRTTLSTQQQRVLALVAEGKTNKEIGSSLELSDKTVKNYIRFIFQKLKVTRRAQAAAFFIRDSPAGSLSGLHPSLGLGNKSEKSR